MRLRGIFVIPKGPSRSECLQMHPWSLESLWRMTHDEDSEPCYIRVAPKLTRPLVVLWQLVEVENSGISNSLDIACRNTDPQVIIELYISRNKTKGLAAAKSEVCTMLWWNRSQVACCLSDARSSGFPPTQWCATPSSQLASCLTWTCGGEVARNDGSYGSLNQPF